MPTTESKDPLMTLPMLTPCTTCGNVHAHRCDKPGDTHQRVLRVLEGAGANFAVTYRDGGYVGYGVERFPDVGLFARLLEREGLGAAYSAGTGWSFTDEATA